MAHEDEKTLFKGMKLLIWSGIIASVVLAVLFLLNQTYDRTLPIDTGIFGTYGDFIGGVLGTIIALYSAYLLIKTLQNQATINKDIEKTNASVVTTNESIVAANRKADFAAQRQYYQNELQIFDGKFSRFFDAYQAAIGAYYHEPNRGRAAFEIIAHFFIDTNFDNNNDYKRRTLSAVDDYLEFYSAHRTEMSVHLRMLYLLVTLIFNSELEEDDKVEYAKLVRGQMSNAEMLIVRYNCLSPYGEKMRPFCNQYNLTKHLSVTSLLEFKAYRRTIEGVAPDESSKLLSGLDVMFISLRKRITKMLYDGNPATDEYKTSHSYTIQLDFTPPDKQTFLLELKKDKDVGRRGGGIRVSPDEIALDKLDENLLVSMFKDFMNELFVMSNFETYNEGIEIRQQGTTINTDHELRFKIRATNNKRLVLTTIQREKRDNPVLELE